MHRRGYEVGAGFLHDIQPRRPSLACDFLELYRLMIDHFAIRLFIAKLSAT